MYGSYEYMFLEFVCSDYVWQLLESDLARYVTVVYGSSQILYVYQIVYIQFMLCVELASDFVWSDYVLCVR